MDAFAEVFRAGGPVMWPILAASLAAWGLTWVAARRVSELLRALDAAVTLLIEHRGPGRPERAPVPPVGLDEIARCGAVLKLLGCLVGLLPLLGLLGTVTGMLGTFDVLRGHGTGEPRLLAGGIREALITTEAGLLLALPVLVFHQILSGRLRRAETAHDLLLHALSTEGAAAAGRFGELAARLGFVGAEEVEDAAASQPASLRLGQHLVDRGRLTPLERRIVLAVKGEAE
jgi:biopolymer transport protein ExbB